jgi:glycosyltransferase involved in cell wall biosynthesis
MRILEICSASNLGGGEVHVIQLVDELRRRGHAIEVAGRPDGPLRCDHRLPLKNAVDLPSALALRRIVRNGGFDIVHAHLAREYPLAAAALLGLRGTRLVLTRQLIHRVGRNPLYRRVDAWIATTLQIERSLGHLHPGRVAVIPNWVDARNIPYRERPPGDPIVIGLLGQVSPHKGHEDALAMIRNLGAGFRLRFGGTGREDYVARLRRDADGLPVEFPGFVEPIGFLDGLDIMILPSWEEPFGIVVLEAMAAGINVIATDAGGPPEILDHGQAGLLVPPRDPDALAGAVRKLVGDRNLARRLGQHARSRVLEHYDMIPIVSRIEDLFRELCAEG